MNIRPVLKAASGGVSRKRTQTAVIFLVLLVSTAAATLGLALLANSSGPFDRGFAAQHGADVTMGFSSARASDGQLAATRKLPGVTGSDGPFPATEVTLAHAGFQLPLATVVGRGSAGGKVDDLTLTAGHWPDGSGQIVLANNTYLVPDVGQQLTVENAPGKPKLTVVGFANSITNTADGWVLPSQVAALRPAGQPPAAEMLYSFAKAGTAAQVRADQAEIDAAVPAGAVTEHESWLVAKAQAAGAGSIIAPFVVAFALIGLVMSVLIVANVVSGAVVAGYRRIGVLKSIGFTPPQVVSAYLARIGLPALFGCLLGVAVGNWLARPVLDKSAPVYGVGSQSVPLWVNVLVPAAMFALVLLTALVPALRAGRLSAIQAIATGQAPSQGRGYAAHRFAAGLRLPRPVSIGLAAPFARPGRTVVTLAAIAFGAVAVIFAVGLDASLAQASDGQTHASAVQVQAGPNGPGGISLGGGRDHAVRAALRSVPGTSRYVAEDFLELGVPGLSQPVNAEAFAGNASWTGYQLISGHWYRGTGQADVNTGFLQATGLSLGDSVRVSAGTSTVGVRIVGEVFDPQGKDQGAMLTSWQTLGGSAAGLRIQQYDIGVKPGVSVPGYASQLGSDLGQRYFVGTTAHSGQFYQIAEGLIAILTLMLAVVAGLGVLNTVLISTRDRVHDLGVFKAVGMTPRQVIAMVVCWVVAPAVIAAAIAIPAAMALHVATVNAMGQAAGTGISSVIMDVYKPAEIVLLALSALVIAAIGALLPAGWAAGARTATALRAE